MIGNKIHVQQRQNLETETNKLILAPLNNFKHKTLMSKILKGKRQKK